MGEEKGLPAGGVEEEGSPASGVEEEEARQPKVTRTITRPWPSQAPRERPNRVFLASHSIRTE
jgi:hypothetical protein